MRVTVRPNGATFEGMGMIGCAAHPAANSAAATTINGFTSRTAAPGYVPPAVDTEHFLHTSGRHGEAAGITAMITGAAPRATERPRIDKRSEIVDRAGPARSRSA